MIEEHYCWQKNPLLFHDDIDIHGCIDETTLSHLNSSCFLCSLFGSYFGGGSSFTSWMKEYMDEYFDAYHILLEQCSKYFSLLQGQEWLPSIYRIEG